VGRIKGNDDVSGAVHMLYGSLQTSIVRPIDHSAALGIDFSKLSVHKRSELQLLDTLSFIVNHPLARQHRLAALTRFARWQITSRIHDESTVDWVDGAVLTVKRGMTGATGNLYCGLHEFAEMAFLLHLLQPGDLFLDIGANIGSYTVLASRVCGADSIAFEPDATTAIALRRNIAANGIEGRVRVEQFALGSRNGEIPFTVGLDTMNRVATANDKDTQIVEVRLLDDVPGANDAVFAKLDVEGFEDEVIKGAMCVLSSTNLLAIQCESHGPVMTDVLFEHGFKQYFYDPISRVISEGPAGYKTSNDLFVRDVEQVQCRVNRAPLRRVYESLI